MKVIPWRRGITKGDLFYHKLEAQWFRQILIRAKSPDSDPLVLRAASQTSVCPYLTDVAVEGMVGLHGRWRDVIRAPPDLDLRLTMFGSSFCLIEASQTPVVSLVKAPSPHHWQPHLVNGIQHCPEGPDCSLLHWGEADVKLIASIWKSKVQSDKLMRCTLGPEFLFL